MKWGRKHQEKGTKLSFISNLQLCSKSLVNHFALNPSQRLKGMLKHSRNWLPILLVQETIKTMCQIQYWSGGKTVGYIVSAKHYISLQPHVFHGSAMGKLV